MTTKRLMLCTVYFNPLCYMSYVRYAVKSENKLCTLPTGGGGGGAIGLLLRRDKSSNGKTSIVCYRTLSFFPFVLKKNESSFFFVFFLIQNHFRTCSLRFDIQILQYKHVRFASKKFFLLSNMFASLR